MRLTLLLLLPVAGCVVAVVGAAAAYGIIKIENNEALRDFRSGVEETWNATKEELKAQGYPLRTDTEPGEGGGEIEADGAVARIEWLEQGYTRVRVSVGTFERESNIQRARNLLNGIAKRLGEEDA